MRMGATTGTVDEVKFGRDLAEVVAKITALTPDILIAATPDGEKYIQSK